MRQRPLESEVALYSHNCDDEASLKKENCSEADFAPLTTVEVLVKISDSQARCFCVEVAQGLFVQKLQR